MCLGQDDMVDLREVLRSDGPTALDAALDRAMQLKPKGHDFVLDRAHARPGAEPAHERDGRLSRYLSSSATLTNSSGSAVVYLIWPMAKDELTSVRLILAISFL